jgi:hypothetical protein
MTIENRSNGGSKANSGEFASPRLVALVGSSKFDKNSQDALQIRVRAIEIGVSNRNARVILAHLGIARISEIQSNSLAKPLTCCCKAQNLTPEQFPSLFPVHALASSMHIGVK